MSITRIRVPNGQIYDLVHLYNDSSERGAVLEPFHRGNVRPECLCTAFPQELVIRKIEGDFRLACYQGTTASHHPRCYFYSSGSRRALQVYTLQAVEERKGGGLFVRLEDTLRLARTELTDQVADMGGFSRLRPRARRNTVTLLGLLHIIWERAGLDRWSPIPGQARRRYGEVQDCIEVAVSQIELPSCRLSSSFYIPPPAYDNGGVVLRTILSRRSNNLVIVCGEFLVDAPTRFGHAVRLVCLKDCPIFVDLDCWLTAVSSFGRPERSENRRTWVIALCRQTERGFVIAKTICWMACSAEYLPVSSEYELQLARLLVGEKRVFTKPLRYDSELWEGYFPDFVLHDAEGGDLPMEVWGMETPEYLQHMREKQKAYGTRLWEWHAYRGETIPELPAGTA